MSITAARLQAEVGADTKDFDRGMGHADDRIRKSGAMWSHALSTAVGVGLANATSAIVRTGFRALSGAITGGFASLRQTGVVVAQTNAVIRSTGASAHVTAGQIRDLSERTEDLTAIDDKAVQAGANMLLTFTNIRNEVGKGNDIFDQSVSILADMSTAMGTDMKSGAIQLGKALNDPITGITALTRVGVTFTDQQKKQIENFVKAGKAAEAQKVILAELNKEFGGSGAAFAATDAGQAAKFQDAIEGIQQSVARGLLPAVTRVRGELDKFLRDPATLQQAQALGDSIASIFSEDNLRTAASLMTTAAGAVSTAIKLFSGLPPQVQALAVGAIALKKITGIGPLDIAKGATGLLKIAFQRGESPATPLFVAPVGAGLAGAGIGTSRVGNIASAVGKVFLVGAAIGVFAELKGFLDNQSAANREQEAGLTARTTAFTKVAGIDDMKRALAGIEARVAEEIRNDAAYAIAYNANIDGVRDAVEAQKAALVAAITRAEAQAAAAQVHAIERAEAIASQKADAIAKAQEDAALANRRSEAASSRLSGALQLMAGYLRSGVSHLPPGSDQVFVPDVKLDPTQVIDVRDTPVVAEQKRAARIARAASDAMLAAQRTEARESRQDHSYVLEEARKARGLVSSVSHSAKGLVALTARVPPGLAKLSADTRSEGSRIATAARAAGSNTAAAVRAKRWQFTNNILVPVTVHSQVSLRSYSTATSTASARGSYRPPE